MPHMTMNRDLTVGTLLGHCIGFKKGVPTFVPNISRVIEECRKYGAELSEEDKAAEAERDAQLTGLAAQRKAVTEMSSDEREAKIVEVLTDMRDNSVEHRENFTAAGRPNAKFVAARVGFSVAGTEVERLWGLLTHGG